MTAFIHVAAAVVINAAGEVLIARRPDHVHQGGLWEFPGGKIKTNESVMDALQRELDEELGIQLLSARPFIRIQHQYPEQAVLLDVWKVERYDGQAHGREGQAIRWQSLNSLADFSFPTANQPIIKALCLPDHYLITPEPGDDIRCFLANLQLALEQGIRLVQLRAKQLDANAYLALAREVQGLCRAHDARLLLNSHAEMVAAVGADGLHLNSQRLMASDQRPLSSAWLVAASCHDALELAQAQAINVDFAVVAPVLPTSSHVQAQPLGWSDFKSLTDAAALPVYALGGMTRQLITTAWHHGAQGIAAISGLWPAR